MLPNTSYFIHEVWKIDSSFPNASYNDDVRTSINWKAFLRILKLPLLLKMFMEVISMFFQSKFNISSISFHL
jgi:hypothetical protein